MRNRKKNIIKLLSLVLLLSLFRLSAPVAQATGLRYELAISPQFERVSAFNEGLAPVKKNGKWGYINEAGELLIACRYDYAYSFENGLAVVITAEEKSTTSSATKFYYGFVDHEGTYTPFLLPHFDTAGSPGADEHAHIFYEGADYDEILSRFLPVFTYGYIRLPCRLTENTERVVLFGGDGRTAQAFYSRFSETDGVLGLDAFDVEPIDYVGENGLLPYLVRRDAKSLAYLSLNQPEQAPLCPKIPYNHSLLATAPFNQGHAVIFLQNAAGQSVAGIVNQKGEWLEGGFYSRIWKQLFSGETFFAGTGLASVQREDGRAGAIDKNGKAVIPFDHEALWPFQEGLAAFQKDGKIGFLDAGGSVVISPQFDDTTGFENGYALVRQGTGGHLIDREGNLIPGSEAIDFGSYLIPGEYGSSLIIKPDRLIAIKEGEVYGFGKITYTPAPPRTGETADWAFGEVSRAIESRLVPARLQNQYFAAASREDFGVLAVSLLQQVRGKDMEALLLEQHQSLYEQVAASPFTDTQRPELVAAHSLGLIQGVGNGRYEPYGLVSRQDAAVLLMRTAQFLGLSAEAAPLDFSDRGEISAYAREAVDFASSLGLLNGVGEGRFAPREHYTRQQAYISMNRLFQLLQTA